MKFSIEFHIPVNPLSPLTPIFGGSSLRVTFDSTLNYLLLQTPTFGLKSRMRSYYLWCLLLYNKKKLLMFIFSGGIHTSYLISFRPHFQKNFHIHSIVIDLPIV